MRNPKNQTAATTTVPKPEQLRQPKIIPVKQPNKKCTYGACDPPKSVLPAGMRRIKVQQKFVARVRSSRLVPVIILAGEWLRKSGFKCQNHVLIIENNGELIIKPDTE